ncbi:hypothetical protein QVD17_33791 [Tagetes erecta]|uniref:Uncharacterized protein n=1 Tax=Tagetes erecta TaxID=13708 RepID=A0AAD8JX44_TARER|nr:hypothetical protein QVD17_33791 [Tagetes erecta]
MDGLTTKLYTGVKRYWRTRDYHRLQTTAVLGHDRPRRRRLWRIRLSRKLKVQLPRSPKRLFISLRDAYVNVMMKLASTSVVRGRTTSDYGFGKTMSKEYDEKVIVEICRNLENMRNQQLQTSSRIACSG